MRKKSLWKERDGEEHFGQCAGKEGERRTVQIAKDESGRSRKLRMKSESEKERRKGGEFEALGL